MSEATIQNAILKRLQAYGPLVSMLANGEKSITDWVKQKIKPEDDAPFPFVTVGDDAHEQWDTDTSIGFDSDLRIHVWDRRRGRIRTKEIQAEIKAALHNHDLFIEDGGCTVLLQWISSSAGPDPSGPKTHHGIQTFRLLMDELG